jgi:pyrophosphatase PpaX
MKNLKYQGVFFDLDGTLLDTTPLILKCFQHTFATHFQRKVEIEDIQPFMGKPLRAAMQAMAPGQEDELIATYRVFNDEHHDELAMIFGGVGEMIRMLHSAGVELAIVTSKTSVMARRGLRLFGLEKYFDPIIGLNETVLHKPDPEPVLAALRLSGLPASECLMVGDSPHDIISGRRAGLKTAAVRWSQVPWPDVLAAKPDYLFDSIGDIAALIFDRAGREGAVNL